MAACYQQESLGEPETTVVHLKRSKGVVVQDCDVYIGRNIYMGGWSLKQSKWANPFSIRQSGSREASVTLYERWVREKPDLLECLPELVGKRLGCWCSPELCHGDVLIKLMKERGLLK
jgi:hypothetical protein